MPIRPFKILIEVESMKVGILSVFTACAVLSACVSVDPYGNVTEDRAGSGALTGAAAGALIGVMAGGDDRRNVLVGAGLGALAGAAIGDYMDRQEDAFRERLRGSGVGVRRIGDELVLTMPSDITFDTDSSVVNTRFYAIFDDVADVFMTYPATSISVLGHADATGSRAYNQQLSKRRAASVAREIEVRGIAPHRIRSLGLGEDDPIASNETDGGRAANRRVEIKVAAITQPSASQVYKPRGRY